MYENNKINKTKKRLIIFSVFLVVAVLLGYVYIRSDYNKLFYVNKSDSEITIDKVSKLVELPKSEKPTVATVSDLNILKDQQFFSKAKIGDKVLIYTKAQKVVLYRPERNIIIDMTPINMQTDN